MSLSMFSSLFFFLLALSTCHAHKEATINELRVAFNQNRVNSRQLVEFYLGEIKKLNPILKGVIEVNPDALYEADRADRERAAKVPRSTVGLQGIPVLLKDIIATKDKLNTTSGSFALLGSVVPRDAGNPYVLSASPCGSSSGPAISVAANLAAVSIGTETDGSILCPAGFNSVVGIKPTVGLTSRAGVVPISPPICRTVSDAVYVLETIAGFDYNDGEATQRASQYIPNGGYAQFLKLDGIKGKRIGVVRNQFFVFANGSNLRQIFESHLQTLRQKGAILIDNLEIPGLDTIFNATASGEAVATIAEFKIAINAYLKALVTSPVPEATNGIGDLEKAAIANMAKLTRDGYEKMMAENHLDAVVTPGPNISLVLAIGGFPGISVPAAYDNKGVP
ncbi:Amidase, partial [Cynara cardunculus var. scolymus]